MTAKARYVRMKELVVLYEGVTSDERLDECFDDFLADILFIYCIVGNVIP